MSRYIFEQLDTADQALRDALANTSGRVLDGELASTTSSIQVSPDGRQLATLNDGSLTLGGAVIGGWVIAQPLSPNGKRGPAVRRIRAHPMIGGHGVPGTGGGKPSQIQAGCTWRDVVAPTIRVIAPSPLSPSSAA